MLRYLLIVAIALLLFSCSDEEKHLSIAASKDGDDYTVTTVVGGGTEGYTDGTGEEAELDGPAGVTVAADGTVWMTDEDNHAVRVIDPVTDTIVTEANTAGAAGFTDGDADTARFNRPDGLAADSNSDIYIADTGNNAIRKLDRSTGLVTTIAGGGGSGSTDGAIAGASFNAPTGIAVDNEDDNILYVADQNNHIIRKIDLSSGQVSTLIGQSDASGDVDDNGAAARLNNPHALTIDAGGNLYVTDMNNHKIKKFNKTALDVVTVAGDGTAGDDDRLRTPHGLAVGQNGDVFVADEGNNKVKKVSVGSIVSTIAGTGQAGFSDTVGVLAKMNQPTGLAIDSNGTLYLCDYQNQRIRKIAK